MKTALRKGGEGRPEHLHRQHRRRPARLGDLPEDAPTTPMDGVVILDQSLPGGSAAPYNRATPPPTRSATGSGSTTRSRAAARATATTSPTPRPRPVAGVRLPGRPRHLHGSPGTRPDQELHGLHRRLLHEHLHGRPGHPHAGRSGRPTAPASDRSACLRRHRATMSRHSTPPRPRPQARGLGMSFRGDRLRWPRL